MHQEQTHHNRAVFERAMEMIALGDYDSLDEVLDPGFVQEMPQSNERVVGRENFRAILANFPGGGAGNLIVRDPRVAGGEEHYVMTPTFNVVKVEGSGDELTGYVKARYPDGSNWYIIALVTFKDGKMSKWISFYAQCYEAPAWRVQWVEEM